MNRTAGLLVVSVLISLVMGPVTALLLPVAALEPKSGPAGTEVTVSVSEYSPNIVIEVHEETGNGALIGTGMTDGSGTAVFPITIPVSAPTRSHLLYICGLCSSEYPEWATRGFQVTGPALTTTTSATTTTTTIAATTTTVAAEVVEPETPTAGDEPTTTTAAEPAVTAEVTAITSAAPVAVAPVGDESGSGAQTVVWILGILIAMLVAFGAGTAFQARQGPQTPPPPPY